jgi:hypothetical protein
MYFYNIRGADCHVVSSLVGSVYLIFWHIANKFYSESDFYDLLRPRVPHSFSSARGRSRAIN